MKIIYVPIRDYFVSRKRIAIKYIIPAIITVISIVIAKIFTFGGIDKVKSIFSQFIDTQINIIAILISFSIAILTIMVTADNKNIQLLKETKSSEKLYNSVNGKQLSLFQILLSNIAYNTIVEILYLLFLITISLVHNLFPAFILKYIVSVCVFIIIHILYVLLESVAQMYLTFWENKK